ncbi:antitoxin of toxin-antitoxin stability system [Sphingomonas sp. GM_Shp_2]|uniref:antitoxin of toxin-antitoxin stability system n=1 Tax=Sphingomonas sp. GM_Shp_2 TaxID=2937380 RepID=UPI00226987B6|nr:antitoxin of toxin-antitoxin stability system [Sphingomonas sp. GM_Shp_2]
MPDFVVTQVFRIEELAASAQATARDWARQHIVSDDWFDPVINDFATVCSIIGVDLAARSVRLYGGGTRQVPRIHFSGFASQGDGASFEGNYRYARRSAAKVRAHAPTDFELHRIADALSAIQRRNIYQLDAAIRQQGRYCHEYTMQIAVGRCSPTGQAPAPAAESVLIECLRDLARWLYRQLECEHDYQTSDEQIDAALEANGCTFTVTGRPFP